MLCLGVDAFGVKYFPKNKADHLNNTLKKYCAVSTDWQGKIMLV